MKGNIAYLEGGKEQLQILRDVLEQHRKEAKEEFLFYKECQRQTHEDPNGGTQHFVFDFAEKVLLPKLLKQPGQLHFVTGLKFDIFGVSSSNEEKNYVFGVPEGHWPNEKTANVVISMLHHVLETQKATNAPGAFARHLKLHADNCAGQNKNRFVLWYLCWRVLMDLNDSIELCFFIAGHTKNVCDGAFGHVKRRLNQTNTHMTSDMMSFIENSSSTTKCVPSVHVDWKDWKSMLSSQFRIPSGLAITKFHVFTFRRVFGMCVLSSPQYGGNIEKLCTN
ncbi:hypothetical protein BWQ96_07787 [Gracilariopsis chorda]|uniref:DUF7869 domain-containing protein n=1 Tax=Gracilariopsis chorda TaxID=448386 RepID=A0A2V3IKA3_9FLOR|nr:hypothetical protein BWQ96_07787 [Gracilariopsis chorda]|eukprot:PXF42478.1 hypothetical protein BWQ96_07787 [Gracilariopsis chorda]